MIVTEADPCRYGQKAPQHPARYTMLICGVAYVGTAVPAKTCDMLASAWEVLPSVPEKGFCLAIF